MFFTGGYPAGYLQEGHHALTLTACISILFHNLRQAIHRRIGVLCRLSQSCKLTRQGPFVVARVERGFAWAVVYDPFARLEIPNYTVKTSEFLAFSLETRAYYIVNVVQNEIPKHVHIT